jgi:ribulose-phosphate 3-epimerase
VSIRIAPSLASAPLDRLAEVIGELEAAQADLVHFYVEDGSFVPVMTLGTKIIRDLRPLTKLPFDVHLMMVNPEWIIPQLVLDGAPAQNVAPYRRAGFNSWIGFQPSHTAAQPGIPATLS